MRRLVVVKSQGGDVLIAVLIVVIVALLSTTGWLLWRDHHKPVSAPAKSSSSQSGASSNSSSAAGGSTAVTACGNLQLSQGTSDGTAGTIYKHAVVTNNGTQTCTLSGYPAVYLLNAGGQHLGAAAAQNALYPNTTVSVAPGASAHVVLGFPDAGAYGSASACSAASYSLELIVPQSTIDLKTAWSDQNCPEFSVTVFQPGA
ncbi:MAG TPA: DUF4232 domain-containing protein [Candidatus Saccharimonadales bacterium]|nr:DUF4232 domain-containing protein [Candidatus Saccharimonadales bacterium]